MGNSQLNPRVKRKLTFLKKKEIFYKLIDNITKFKQKNIYNDLTYHFKSR